MLEIQLEKLGLHKNEIKVYLALFDLGKIRAGKIIEHTNLHRNLIYTALEELTKKGLTSKVLAKGVAMFEANDPKTLIQMAEEQRTIAEEVTEELKNKQKESTRDIKIFEGFEGVKKSRERSLSLKPDETVYVLGGSQLSSTEEYEAYWRTYHKKRIKKNINLKILYDRTTDPGVLEWRNKLERTEAHYLPFNIETPTWIEMYGDIIGIGVPGDDPIVFSMKNKIAVESLKKYFEYFWNLDTQILRGPKALQQIWLEAIDYQELRLISARGYFIDRYPDLYKVIEEKAKKTPGIKWRNIVDPGVRGHHVTKLPWAETKYTLSGVKNPNVVWLYGPKVIITNWAGDEPIMFVSTNKQLVQSYNDYFEELWKIEK